MRFSILASALVFSVFASVPAFGSILFGPAVRYETLKTTDQTSFAGGTGESSSLVGDAHLGFLIEGTPLYFGGLYSYESAASGGTTNMTGTSYGASVGYYSGALSIIGTYLLAAERTYPTSTGENKLRSGSGFRVDLAYVAGIANAIGLGPQLTYSSVKYAKSQVGSGAESTNSFETTSFTPGLVLWFRF